MVVDDDEPVRDSVGLVLAAAGYDESLAENGIAALSQLEKVFPTVIISDLNMPQMSGFEFLSVVRRRFPHISLLAMSGEYHCEDAVPEGVMADAFYPKGRGTTDGLLKAVATLIHNAGTRAVAHEEESTPVWMPTNGDDSAGIPYVVLSCTECLRSFPMGVVMGDQSIQETPCLFCSSPVRYIIDFSPAVAVSRSQAEPVTMIRGRMKTATRA